MPRIAVFVSGGGSNLQALIDSDVKSSIAVVVADRPASGLERARKVGIETVGLSRKELGKTRLSEEIEKVMAERKIDLIVLAGYLSIFTEEFSARWRGKMINIHPALLPKFGGKGMYGHHVHEAVLAAGEKESGCTVHFLGEGVDNGEIILQAKVPVKQGDSPDDLAARVLAEEHKLLPQAVLKVMGEI
ncbi:MAG: phosphoribosylglycinamide formyltransferase [Spirochaetales bacterium]|nr:phosphoribosylglycinamide formyltransferase [Spirochaetales bacterium]